MIAIEKRSTQTILANYGNVSLPDAEFNQGSVDPEIFQRQCALLEHNEEAAKQRARENEYWRQRTLARKKQFQESAHPSNGLADIDHALGTMDSKHRIDELLNVLMDEYNKLKPSQQFLEWIGSMTLTAKARLLRRIMEDSGQVGIFKTEWVRAFDRSVRYKYAAARGSYQIQIRNGVLYQNGALFDTGEMKTELSGAGVAIFVQSADGTFYSSSHVRDRLSHANLTADVVIRSAGEWQVEKGKIAWISGKCGHYTPTMDQLVTAIDDLAYWNALHQCKARVYDCQNRLEVDINARSLASKARCFGVRNNG